MHFGRSLSEIEPLFAYELNLFGYK